MSSSDYAEALLEAQKQSSDAKSIYEILAIADIQAAADIMRPVYERTNKADGYVSIEVSPFIAHETDATIAEARRLWLAIARSNVMIKVPATPEGVPAIRQLISEGINVNITLLFALEAYEKIADAYLTGLEARAAVGDEVSGIASVASFFVSRIDTIVDKRLSESMAKGANPDDAKQLLGKGDDRQREDGLSQVSRDLRIAALGSSRRKRRAEAAATLGQHWHEKSKLSGHALCRGADRAGNREHDSARDAPCVPRSWPRARKSRGKHRPSR